MKRNYQYSFGKDFKTPLFHGGDHSVGKRKTKRPIHTKKALHLVLRAECARGRLSLRLPRHQHFIERKMRQLAQRWGIRIYSFSNNSNHLHLRLKATTRIGFQNFLRAFSAQVAAFVTQARRGKPFGKRFWDRLAYTRVVEWGKAFSILRDYVAMNQQEAVGLPSPRGRGVRKARSRRFPIHFGSVAQ